MLKDANEVLVRLIGSLVTTFVLVSRSKLCSGLDDLIEDTKDIFLVMVRRHIPR